MDARLIVTIDTESDKTSNWHVKSPLSFEAVSKGIAHRLHPLFGEFGIRPTYFLSPEVLCHRESVAVLKGLPNAELAAHLHGDFIVPNIKTWNFGGSVADDMQFEYGPALEKQKLTVLTELFTQQIGRRPVSFRAGRFGISPQTGQFLEELGYKVDSSVTPHIVWTDKAGNHKPDFRGLPEFPYRVSKEGDICKTGLSKLLEVPVTLLREGTVAVNNPNEPVWFRPWYSDKETLCRVLDFVVQQPAQAGVQRPLVMMFHNVELIAGASPYPQTEAEVERFLDQLRHVFSLARTRGLQPCTLAEYYEESSSKIGSSQVSPSTANGHDNGRLSLSVQSHFDPALRLPASLVEPILDKHQVQPWFKYIFKDRKSRWDVWQPCVWIKQNCRPNEAILSVGTGVGFNLFWLALEGFTYLEGFDMDPKAIAAARDIALHAGLRARFWMDDGLAPQHLANRKYAVIKCLIWTHLLERFSLEKLLDSYLPHLTNHGVFIIDVIDRAYDLVPNNQWHTADVNKPIAERRPNEYRTRMSEDDVRSIFESKGFRIVAKLSEPQKIPKAVYIARRYSTMTGCHKSNSGNGRIETSTFPPSATACRSSQDMMNSSVLLPSLIGFLPARGCTASDKTEAMLSIFPLEDQPLRRKAMESNAGIASRSRAIPSKMTAISDLSEEIIVPFGISILLLYDVKGWAWWHKSKQIQQHLPANFQVSLLELGTSFSSTDYDLIVIFDPYHYERHVKALNVPPNKLLVGCSCPLFLDQMLDLIRQNHCLGGFVNNLDTYNRIADRNQICHCPNGVDTDLFHPAPHLPKRFAACWVGNSKSRGKKGLEILQDACHRTGVPLLTKDIFAAENPAAVFTQEKIRDRLYHQSSTYLCASEVEGTPNPALEALACGLPVISTRVGNMPEIIVDGYNGFLAERNVESFAAAIEKLHKSDLPSMSRNARQSVEESWSWKQRTLSYQRMFCDLFLQAKKISSLLDVRRNSEELRDTAGKNCEFDLFRSGVILGQLERWDEALEAVCTGLAMDGTNHDARRLLLDLLDLRQKSIEGGLCG